MPSQVTQVFQMQLLLIQYNTCVTWQDIDYKLPDDDMIVSKHVGVFIICEIIMHLLVIVQNNKR
jgi:hypothetical protein